MAKSSSRPPQGLRVFVVDDDPAMGRLVAEVIRSLHHQPHVFEDAESALLAHQEQPADLFTIDWILPGMDGLALVRKVRSGGPGRNAVMLVMTGRDRPDDLALVLDAGATDYLTKPLNPDLLRTRLLIAERTVGDRLHRRAAEEERSRVHEALRRSQQDFRQITEGAPVGIFIQRDGKLLYVNPEMQKITGRSADDVLGDEALAKVHPDDREVFERNQRAWLTGNAPVEPTTVRLVRADGETIWVEVLPGGQVDFAGEPARLAVVRDVTASRALIAKLHLADRLASVGTLATGVAHEVNNPLGYVSANLEVLAERLPKLLAGATEEDRADVLAAVDEARDGTQRVQRIVRQLGRFAQQPENADGVADVTEAIDAALRITANEVRHRARLIREIEELPPAVGDEARLSQVFVNLLVNAAQALDPARARQNRVCVRAYTAGGRVFVSVEDNGPGIPAELQSRVFDPFFTTKGVGEGTGLGLAICHGLVTKMGGEIGVDSETGRGTRVTVSLEARPDAQLTGRVSSLEPAPSTRRSVQRGRILVVDDEYLVGRSLKRALTPHEVIVATSVTEAMEIVRHQEVDVILCDLMMPDGGGIDFHTRIEAERPELLPILCFMTGGAFMPEAREFLQRVDAPTFKKPFDLAKLREHVDGLISG
ncbi:MAG: response regulator [Deltaproteobacteria bacterium]|nr:response regulator [Deltaproteobacteria bacterium]